MESLSVLRTVIVLAITCFGQVVHSSSKSHDGRIKIPEFLPRGLSVGTAPCLETGHATWFSLNSSYPVATIDYGIEVAGYPFFNVLSISQTAQIEVKYSEQFDALGVPWADGPFTYATSLANAFRVETFNITSPGRFTAFLIQGGQRWQSIRLLSQGTIVFEKVGFEASIDTTDVQQFPGRFDSNDQQLNDIWKLGAVAASAACVEKGTQRAVWEVDRVKGAHVRSLRPALSLAGAAFANYTLEFDALIERGGIWWSVAWPLGEPGGIQLQLVSSLSEASSFINTNRTLTPPNSILLSYGYGFVNQTTLTSFSLDTFNAPFIVQEQAWYHITTVLMPSRYLSVAIDGRQVFNVSISDYYTGQSVPFGGSFGFGAWQDQAAYVRNVTIMDTVNGEEIYRNEMTSSDILAEFGVQANVGSVCLDGAKRDRLVWLGDFYHTSQIIGASTSRFDLSKSTLQFFLDTQIEDGEFNISPGMGYDPKIQEPWAPEGAFALSDYQILGLISFHSYIRQTRDLQFAQQSWPKWQSQMRWLLGHINAVDGLMHFPSAFLGSAIGGSAVSCAAVQAFRGMAEISLALEDNSSYSLYASTADSLTEAINDKLWNDELGVYSLDTVDIEAYSVAGISFCITSGVATANKTLHSIAALEKLKLQLGYLDSTTADPLSAYISPNTNGFLLEALLEGNASSIAFDLIRSLWASMLKSPLTATGASWEYVSQEGEPGLGLFTSLSHPWGGAATYILTKWAAGIQAASGYEGFGYMHWVIMPEAGIDIGLERACAQVLTLSGPLSVTWVVSRKQLDVNIKAPLNTTGTFKLKNLTKLLNGKPEYNFIVQL